MDRTDPLQRCIHLLLLLAIIGHQTTAYNPPSSMLSDDPQVGSEDSLDSLRPELEELKRSSAFYPLRGKKNPLLLDDEDDLLLKRSQFYPLRGKKASYFMPMRGRKSDEEDKRMSSFLPMRGKKSIDSILSSKPGTYLPPPSSSSSLVTLSGSHSNNSSDIKDFEGGREEDKRGRSVFNALRGRREDQDHQDRLDVNPLQGGREEDKRGRSVFNALRGRREDSLQDHQDRLDMNPQQGGMEEDKRGRSVFNALRGRREDQDLNGMQEHQDRLDMNPLQGGMEEKRGRSVFNALRGRREDQDMLQGGREDLDMNLLQGVDKRGRSVFNALRGRREDEELNETGREDQDSEEDEKRAMGFVPMRGRRFGLGSSLMARSWLGSSYLRSVPRGRKVDWDSVKRGFHATRGKRMEDEGCRCKRSVLRNRQQYSLALKRPMSFFATRGKRMDSSAPSQQR